MNVCSRLRRRLVAIALVAPILLVGLAGAFATPAHAVVFKTHYNQATGHADSTVDANGQFTFSYDHQVAIRWGGHGIVSMTLASLQQEVAVMNWTNDGYALAPDSYGDAPLPAVRWSNGDRQGECPLFYNYAYVIADMFGVEMPFTCEVLDVVSDTTSGEYLHLIQCRDNLTDELIFEETLVEIPDQFLDSWATSSFAALLEFVNALDLATGLIDAYEQYYLWFCEAESRGVEIPSLPPGHVRATSTMYFNASIMGLQIGGGQISGELPSGMTSASYEVPSVPLQTTFSCPSTHYQDDATRSCQRKPQCDPPKVLSADGRQCVCPEEEQGEKSWGVLAALKTEQPQCTDEAQCPEGTTPDGNGGCQCPAGTVPWISADGSGVECLTIEPPLGDDPLQIFLSMADLWFNDREWHITWTECERVDEGGVSNPGTYRVWVDPPGQWEERQINDGLTTYYECREVTYRQGGLGVPKRRHFVFDGLHWWHDTGDPDWQDPFTPPSLDLAAMFGPCHAVDGQQVTPCTGQPSGSNADLAVVGTTVLGPPAPGDAIELVITTQNLGTATAPNTRYRATWQRPDGSTRTQEGWVGSLQAGATRALAIRSDENSATPFTAEVGTYSFSVALDSLGELVENDEGNNTTAASFSVAQPSAGGVDLRAIPLAFDLDHPIAGQTVRASIGVENVGTVAAPPSRYALTVSPPASAVIRWTGDVPALAAGQRWTDTRLIEVGDEGLLGIALLADSEEQVSESSEHNNHQARSLEVHSPLGCGPCTSGSPRDVGTLLCFDPDGGADPALGTAWQCLGVRPDGSTCVPSGDHPNGWGYAGTRCPDPSTLCSGTLHSDRCGTPGLCPGTLDCG
ncbi:MAG: CARDB domain-containing protein [Acidobacteriota bacterium]